MQRVTGGKSYNAARSTAVALQNYLISRARLKGENVDVIVSAMRATEIALFPSSASTALITDAPFPCLQDYYESCSGLSLISRYEAMALERRAVRNARVLACSTDWAAQAAIDKCQADSTRVHVIPFGPNLDLLPGTPIERQWPPTLPWELLFVGRSWERKGGDIALQSYRLLRSMGVDCRLTICGVKPPVPLTREDRVRVVPYLDMTLAAERKRLSEIYRESDLLFLPSRVECYGIVFAEAAAFGLPVVATDTGGVSGVVRHGVTGLTLPMGAGPREYAVEISKLLSSQGLMKTMSAQARREYERRLNWDSWGQAFSDSLKSSMSRNELCQPR
jgi:glycosyltransferase involved in cell wall biosynthesis